MLTLVQVLGGARCSGAAGCPETFALFGPLKLGGAVPMEVVAVLLHWARNSEVDQTMKCPSCRTRELVVINMVVKGEPITFRSCSACDRRWWEGLDGPVELDAVLDQARSD